MKKRSLWLLRLLFVLITCAALLLLAGRTPLQSSAAVYDQGFDTLLEWNGFQYKLTHGLEEVLPQGYAPAALLESPPGKTHGLAGKPLYARLNAPGMIYVQTDRGYGLWTVTQATDPVVAFGAQDQQQLLAHFDVPGTEVFQCIPVTDGTDGLLGVVQYRKPGSTQFFLSFVTENHCYTAWLPKDWHAAEGTVLTYLGENTVEYTTAPQAGVPAVQWQFTYSRKDGQSRITANWQAVCSNYPNAAATSSLFLSLHPLLHVYSAFAFLDQQYPGYQWDVLPVEQYTLQPAEDSDLQTWAMRTQGILAIPDAAGTVRYQAFEVLHLLSPDTELTRFYYDDTLPPEALSAQYLNQENRSIAEVLAQLKENP